MPETKPICALTIGGLDPSGGAGIPADARAMREFGVHACAITTCIVAQNTRGVQSFQAVAPEIIAAQMSCLLEDVPIRAIKIGLIPTLETAQTIADCLNICKYLQDIPLIYDTVFAPSSGAQFVDEKGERDIVQVLADKCELLTPNLNEAEILSGIEIVDLASLRTAAQQIQTRFGIKNLLLKGGHLEGVDANQSVDYWWHDGQLQPFSKPRLASCEVRGTGCLLASAIAARRARGVEMDKAIAGAKAWLYAQLPRAAKIGEGRGVVV